MRAGPAATIRRREPLGPDAANPRRAVLALGDDGHLTVRTPGKRLPEIEFDNTYTTVEAIEEILRWSTHFETEAGLALLVRCVRRDAKLPQRARRDIIRRIAPTLVVGATD